MRSAGKSGAAFALLIGEDELKAGAAAIKPLKAQGEQFTVPLDEAPAKLKELLQPRTVG